jgi:hypothetical protein
MKDRWRRGRLPLKEIHQDSGNVCLKGDEEIEQAGCGQPGEQNIDKDVDEAAHRTFSGLQPRQVPRKNINNCWNNSLTTQQRNDTSSQAQVFSQL